MECVGEESLADRQREESVDLALIDLAEHAGWSGDLTLLHELAPAVDAALGRYLGSRDHLARVLHDR
jgi:hypothetical protein